MAEPTAQEVAVAQREAAIAAERDSMTIVDPGQRHDDDSTSQTPPPAKPSPTSTSGLSQDLLDRAARAGISADEARSVPASFLARHLDSLELPIAEFAEPEPPAQNFRFDPYTGEPIGKKEPAPQFPELPDMGDVEFHPALKKAWTDQQKAFTDQLKARDERLAKMEAALSGQNQASQQREQMEGFRTVESLIQGDTEFADVFGAGPAHQHAGTRLVMNRQELAQTMDALARAKSDQGYPVPDAPTLYKMAKAALYPDRITTQAKTEVTNNLSERARDSRGRLLPKPTSTTRQDGWEGMPKGERRAELAVAAYMRNNGIAN